MSSESFEDKSKLVFYKDIYTSEYKVNANNQAEITIYSIHGGIQGKQTIVSGENVLNIQHFDKGVYIVRITSDNGEIINTKILKY